MDCSASDVRAIRAPPKGSRKGENGVLLVIGGSKSYFGAPLHALRAASLFVDLGFFSPFPQNNALASQVKLANADLIVERDWRKAVKRADAILVGPGFEGTGAEKRLVDAVLRLGKPVVLDAPAIWLADKRLFGPNVAVTPHAGEFEKAFGVVAGEKSCFEQARKFNCNILLKNHGVDYVTDGKKIFSNKSGIPAMTKGGTGDVLAGLAAAFACKTPLLASLKAAAFLNGFAGRRLYKRANFAFTATDLANEIPSAFAALRK
jgi:NAD(P)H-hydrate epimerase